MDVKTQGRLCHAVTTVRVYSLGNAESAVDGITRDKNVARACIMP